MGSVLAGSRPGWVPPAMLLARFVFTIGTQAFASWLLARGRRWLMSRYGEVDWLRNLIHRTSGRKGILLAPPSCIVARSTLCRSLPSSRHASRLGALARRGCAAPAAGSARKAGAAPARRP